MDGRQDAGLGEVAQGSVTIRMTWSNELTEQLSGCGQSRLKPQFADSCSERMGEWWTEDEWRLAGSVEGPLEVCNHVLKVQTVNVVVCFSSQV